MSDDLGPQGGWTVGTLKTYFDRQFVNLHHHLSERYNTQLRSIDQAFNAQQTAMEVAFSSADKAVDKALEAAEKAVARRQDTLDREFHEHLEQVRHENALAFLNSDKAINAAFAASDKAINKAEIASEKRFASIAEAQAQLLRLTATFMPRQESLVMHQRTGERIDDLMHRLDKAEGRGSGYQSLYGWAIGGAGVLIGVVVLANAVFGK